MISYRRGQLGEQMMVFMFIFFMVIIGGGIVIGTGIFIGPEFDFRASEAVLLNYHIRNCFLGGNLDNRASISDDVIVQTAFISERCKLNKNLIGTYDFI